ncbi:MAG: hypothetical protein JSU08_16780 [Acidobacteria bacterium]|nr:hypothetical protein [Acidobacteriota bacterium]
MAKRTAARRTKAAASRKSSSTAGKKTAKSATTRRAAATPASAKKTATRKTTGKKAAAPAKKAAAKKSSGTKRTAVAKKSASKKKVALVPMVRRRAVPSRPAAAPKSKGKPAAQAKSTPKPAASKPRNAVIEARRRRGETAVPTPPSSLNMNRRGTAARTGREEMAEERADLAGMNPTITGGDVDVDVENAYFSGDEAPGGDNPTPDQDIVDDIGRALGVEYQDNEELRGADKLEERDRHRWELDPASSEDYKDRR